MSKGLWHPISDRPPKDGEYPVLVLLADKYYRSDNRNLLGLRIVRYSCGLWSWNEPIVAWFDLPDPPEWVFTGQFV